MQVALQTLGCKLNQAEIESLAWNLLRAGYQLRGPDESADIYLLNTCTVTHIADRKSRHLLRLARRRNPNALVIATGCYAQRAPEELAQMKEVNLVLGNREKECLAQILGAGQGKETKPHPTDACRTRSLVKIQDGCNSFCSFCIIPWVRGRESSVSPDHVRDEVEEKIESGYREITLTGTKIGSYAMNGVGLVQLVRRILSETGVERLRLSSLQPRDLHSELLGLWNDPRLCRHLHLPLQSGCDAVLQRMKRRYSTGDYKRAVSLARDAIPGVSITTDIIVGFPGESEEEFEESYCFCRRMEFARIHVFPYSPRPGTPATEMPNRVNDEIKRGRVHKMLGLAQESAHRFRERLRGQTAMVLWESRTKEGLWTGFTDNYVRVFSGDERDLLNQLLPTKVISEHEGGVGGVIS
jgi:threonylcarbamoyladenosine tRNA methylthiotransferase MtaB